MSQHPRVWGGVLASTLVLVLTTGPLAGQADTAVAKATDLSVPSVPAFTLLDVNAATVVRPGLVEDFNFDLLIKNEELTPDLALEARPVWIFGFRTASRSEYVDLHYLARMASTLSISLGTTAQDSSQELAWAAKVSLIRPDPLLDSLYIRELGKALDVDSAGVRLKQIREDSLIEVGRGREATSADTARINAWYEKQVEKLARSATRNRLEDVREAVKAFQERTWNATAVDLAFGQVYQYEGASFDDLTFDGSGFGGWVSAATGFGTKRWLFTVLGRWVDLGEDLDQGFGANARFGGTRVNGFIEYLYDAKEDDSEKSIISYGGEIRIDANRVIEFGLRTEYDEEFALDRLRPVIKIRWKVGETLFEELFGT